MKKKTLLRIDASLRVDDSHSRRAAGHFESCWLQTHPSASVIRRDLASDPPPHLDGETLAGFFDPNVTSDGLAVSDRLIHELRSCDALLISSPVYNFHLPSTLKAYFDLVTRSGVTFSCDETGNYRGLLNPIPCSLIFAQGARAGGAPEAEPACAYLSGICQFLGLGTTTLFLLDGTAAPNFGPEKTQAFHHQIEQHLSL